MGIANTANPSACQSDFVSGSTDLVRARTQVGDFELTICTDGTYRLDGGAMFGVVPKVLWQRRAPADEQNRILLGLNTVVVRTGRHTVVIETGIGNKQSAKMREIHCNQELLPTSLAAAGISVEEVDIVINTHLHFDHCGWNTTLHPDGSVTPTFPNARYFAHLDPTWVMGYDLDPLECIAQRKRFYQRAIPENWLVLFTHDHETPMGRVGVNDKGKPVMVANE
jgi:glyoxylase-like metal-dependent hydrolase (beta-lactamase superfamily II)